jgi:hypothetical protein
MVKNEPRRAYYLALLNEIRMLVDYIAATATKTIGEIQIKDLRSPHAEANIGGILMRLDEISAEFERPSEAETASVIKAEDTAFLQIFRDLLNGIARPASSLTIAYTALVTGTGRGKDAESREKLARKAYGGMISTAHWHRRTQRLFLVLALAITVLAVRESSNVALGRDYMRNLANLQTQQADLAQEKTRLEALLPAPLEGVSVFGLCGQESALANDFKQEKLDPALSAQVQDLCGRDYVLAKNFGIVHDQLRQ